MPSPLKQLRANFLARRDDKWVMAGDPDWAVIASSVEAPERFAALYERHLARVGSYLARRVGAGLAEDLTSEVFVEAFRGRVRFRRDFDTALPWLLGIASNLVAQHRRAERRRLAALERAARLVSPPIADDAVGEVAPAVLAALRRLPVADRDALLLVVWGELSYEEAAAALGVPVGTIRSRISRARSRLASALESRHDQRPRTGELATLTNGEADG